MGVSRSPRYRRARPAPPGFRGSKASGLRTEPMVARTTHATPADSRRGDLPHSWLFFSGREPRHGRRGGQIGLMRKFVVEKPVHNLAVVQPAAGSQVAHVIMAKQL